MNIEYSIPKCVLNFLFHFHNLCHKVCVQLWPGPLISKAWSYPLPTHQSTLPCPWTAWPKSFMHIAPCQLQNMNGIITQLRMFCIFHADLYFGTICLNGSWCIVARISRPANVLFQTMLQEMQIQVCSFKACYSFAPHHCMPASWALQEPPQAIA